MPYSAATDPFCHNGRQLPSLFLVGAMKCGTTSLAQQLFDEYGYSRGVKFPDSLGWSDEKEHHFFELDSRFKKGLDYYATSFPPCGEHVMTIDATPNYFYENAHKPAARIKELGAGARKKTTVRVVVHGGEAGARTKKKLKVDAAALATLDELLDAVRSELPPPKGRRADLGRVRVTIEDAEGGTIEVEDDDDMADAPDARCVHVRGWPL